MKTHVPTKKTHFSYITEEADTACGAHVPDKQIRKTPKSVTCHKCKRFMEDLNATCIPPNRIVTPSEPTSKSSSTEPAGMRREDHKMPRIVWYARGGGIAKMGPFDSQVRATDALRLGPDTKIFRNSSLIFPSDAFVWPEEV